MENKSGIYPCGDKILIKPDIIEETTQGGIVLPEQVVNAHMDGQTSGTLIAAGIDAWNDYSQAFATVGDKVMFSRYSGQRVWGKDGEQYRVVYDQDITAVLEDGVSFSEFSSARKPLKSKK